MGTFKRRRSVRTWLALTATAAAAASGLAVLGGVGVGVAAQTSDFFTFASGNPVTQAEGGLITSQTVGHFTEAGSGSNCNPIAAKIDWGDNTTPSDGSVYCVPGTNETLSEYTVQGSHVYDVGTYDISISVTDLTTSESDSRKTDTASISDGALTAGSNKSLTATAGKISSSTVGSFSDAAGAQASAADFTASTDWGDGSTSVTSVKQTGAGTFDVTGAHGYAGTGTKSITTVVTDEEGQSVTVTATATVHAAPAPPVAALPTTGQPRQPSSPLPLALLILGAMAVLGAGGTLLFRRTTR